MSDPQLSGKTVTVAYPIPTRDSPVKLTPLSILYPGKMWQSQGCEVFFWDERFDSLEQLDEWILRSTDFATSAFTGYQCGAAGRLLKRAKRLNPSITTHLGGYHARLLPEQVAREPYVDEVWPGKNYGEWLMPFAEDTAHHFKRTDMQYYTSRGCPFPCTFCALTSPWQPKDIESLERELKTIHDAVGFSEISFSDPNIGFGVYKDDEGKTVRMDRILRMKAIGQVMRDLGVTWDGNIRSPYLTPQMIEVLAWGGCTSLEIGCESGDDWYLKRVIRKGHGVDAIKAAALNIRGSGISVMYSFLAFAPHETEAQRRNTYDLIDWIVDTDPLARVSLYKFAPYPGSPLYDDAVAGRGTGFGCDVFTPPKNMEEWGRLKLMVSPIYWITGLCFRMDNTKKNFAGEDWRLIEPYVEQAKKQWRAREMDHFPIDEVERLVQGQVLKANAQVAHAFAVAGA